MKILDGRKTAAEIKTELREQIAALKAAGISPGLAVVLVGENPASQIYVRMKTRACQELGIFSQTIRLETSVSQQELLQTVRSLNTDTRIHGILVQLPLPPQIDEQGIIHAIDPDKDVDGFHPVNRGRLVTGERTFVPCTPLGIQELLLRNDYSPEGKHVVILGRSHIVGLPLATLLVQKQAGANATVTICHTGTKNLANFTQKADIIVAAVGRPEVVTGDMVAQGVIVVDVGINRVEDKSAEKGYRVVGDVHFESVAEKAAALTPVPGGVGPMTIAMLLKNTVEAARKQLRQ